MATSDKQYTLTIDIARESENPDNYKIVFNESDVQSTFIKANLVNDGVPVDLTNTTVRLNVLKADNLRTQCLCQIEDTKKGKVKLVFERNAINVIGLNSFQVELETFKTAYVPKKTISPRFYFTVEESLVKDEDIVMSDDFPVLVEWTTKVKKLHDKTDEQSRRLENLIVQTEATNQKLNTQEKQRQDKETERDNKFEELKTNQENAINNIPQRISDNVDTKLNTLKGDLEVFVNNKFSTKSSEYDSKINTKLNDVDSNINGKINDWNTRVQNAIKSIPGKEELKGKDGASIIIKGKKNKTSDLPNSDNSVGDAYVVDGDIYSWTESMEWINLGRFKGDTGASAYDMWKKKYGSTVSDNSEVYFVDTLNKALGIYDKTNTELNNLIRVKNDVIEITNKSIAWENQEVQRVNNEEVRISKEEERKSNEDTRISNETSRQREYEKAKKVIDGWIANPEQFRGKMGQGLNVKGTISNKSSLPSDNNKIGDTYSVPSGEDCGLYTWNNDRWIFIGGLKGEKGDSIRIQDGYFYIGDQNTGIKTTNERAFVDMTYGNGVTTLIRENGERKIIDFSTLTKVDYNNIINRPGVATTTRDGLMSSTDKTNLDNYGKRITEIENDISKAIKVVDDMTKVL